MHSLPPALLCALLLALAPAPARAARESGTQRMTFTAQGQGEAVSRSLSGAGGHATAGSGGLSLTVYPREPLADDGSPISLWPFLQRADSFTVGASAGAGSLEDEGARGMHVTFAGVHAGLDVYALPWLAFSTSAQAGFGSWTSDAAASAGGTFGLSVAASAGLRFGHLRADVGYRLDCDWLGKTALAPLWGRIFLGLRWVARRAVDVQVFATTLPEGAAGELKLTWYTSRSLGLFAAGGAGVGKLELGLGSREEYLQYFGRLGATWWFAPRIGLSASYRLMRSSTPVGAESFVALGHEGSLALFARL